MGSPEWRKSWVSVCCWRGHGHVKNPIASSSEGWPSRPPGTKCVDSEYRECPSQLPPPRCLQPRDCLLTKTAPTEISGTCSLDPAVLYKPCLLVPVYNNPFFLFQWYAMALPLCSILFNKHTELPDGWGFSVALTIQSPLSDYVCSCLSVCHFFITSLPRSSPFLEPCKNAVNYLCTRMIQIRKLMMFQRGI